MLHISPRFDRVLASKRRFEACILGFVCALGAQPTQSQDAPTRRAQPAPTASAAQPAVQLRVERNTLGNGLRIVLNPDPSIPTVAIAVYYDVGSRNEERGRSGFAHLFEHMMFQGSANVDKGEHFSLIENRGGDMNGTTSEDRTNYFETLPSNELPLGLWLEADRMRSLAVTAENFENQRAVVMEERRQSYENRPYSLSFLRINELLYRGYWPYEHTTIGDMADLQNAPLADVQAFWTHYYGPNNAVLSISGDFDPAATLALIENYFGSIARREVPAYNPPAFAEPTEAQNETMQDALAELPAIHFAWSIPPNREPDHYPLELLTIILGDGESSRLYKTLVHDREVAAEVHVSTDDRRGPDAMNVFAIASQNHTLSEIRTLVDRELTTLAQRGVTARELDKAKNRIRAGFVFGLQQNLHRAMNLAEFEMYFGDANLLSGELERYTRVTRADIQRVARQYLTAQRRTTLEVIPTRAAAAAAGGAQ